MSSSESSDPGTHAKGGPHDDRIPIAQKELSDPSRSKIAKYCDLVIGRRGLGRLILYESVLLSSAWLPGALGLFLRSKLYPWLLGSCGSNVTFGQNIVLRHPHKIHIGSNVVVDDHCLLDAKGSDNEGIFLEDGVFIGRNTILSCKNGNIYLGKNANLGFNCEIFSADEVRIGPDVMVAAYVYLVGGDHMRGRTDLPVSEQGRIGLPIRVGGGGWLGAHAVVGGGVSIGKHAIIGAGAVVLHNVGDYEVAAGVPAKIVRSRQPELGLAPPNESSAGLVQPGQNEAPEPKEPTGSNESNNSSTSKG